MGRYYFHTESATRYTDLEGAELPDMEAARVMAAKVSGQALINGAPRFWGSRPWTTTVTDADGLIFFTIELHGMGSAATHGS